MNSPRVFFVVESLRFDTSSAEKLGEKVFIFGERTNMDIFTDPNRFLKVAMVSLHRENYDPKKDYIALTGPAMLLALFLGQILFQYRTIKVLLFDARTGTYIPHMLSGQDERTVISDAPR